MINKLQFFDWFLQLISRTEQEYFKWNIFHIVRISHKKVWAISTINGLDQKFAPKNERVENLVQPF